MRVNFCGLVLAVCAWTSVAMATPRAVVREFDGQNSKRVRGSVVAVLQEHGVELVAAEAADQSASTQNADLATDAGRVSVAKELRVSVFVEGSVQRAGSKLRVSIKAYAGSDGASLGDMTVTATKANVGRAVTDGLWEAIGAAVESATLPAEQESEQAEPEPEAQAPLVEKPAEVVATEPVADQDEFEPKHSPLDVSLGARFGRRDFVYSDAFPGLRDYKLGLSPSLALHVHWYPAAHVTHGFVANLGLDVRAETLVGVKSKNSAGTEFATSSQTIGLGVRLRIPLDKNEVGFMVGYAAHSFSISNSNKLEPGVPDVSHGSLRAGAEARWLFLDPLSLHLAAAYLLSVSPGELAQSAWFPNTTGGGIDAELGLGFGVIDAIELQLAFDIERYFFTFHPKPTDAAVLAKGRVAGGALDQYLSLRASLLWRM
jgi:hypothetical protein